MTFRRRVAILGISLFVIVAGAPRETVAVPRGGCEPEECSDFEDCDPIFCNHCHRHPLGHECA